MRPFNSYVASLLFIALCIYVEAGGNRDEAFIGYSERSLECQDRLSHCRDKGRHDGCLLDPYNMRTFCPISCAVSKCMSTGTIKVRHSGFATKEDTNAFALSWSARAFAKSNQDADKNMDNFRIINITDSELTLSSLGIGTYLGDVDSRTDDNVASAVIHSVMHGWNVIDTASNYRWGRAESSIGAALDSLLAGSSTADFLQEEEYAPDITRSMLFISTKVGFTDEALVRRLIEANQLSKSDVTGGHTMAPAYIKASVDASLERLGLKTVDLLYLHNPAEMQLRSLGWPSFRQKLKQAFAALESLRTDGSIRSYGLATWDCFRVPPTNPGYVSLEEVVNLAKEAAGGNTSGFAAVQLPVSALMPEAWEQSWQPVRGEAVSLMEAADLLGVTVFTSGPLGEGELLKQLTSRLDPVVQLRSQPTTAQKLLQLARSTPGKTMSSTLVGQKTREFVESNTRLAMARRLEETDFREAMRQVKAILRRGSTEHR